MKNENSDETKVWYQARVKCYEIKAHTGTILTEENTEKWVGEDDGYAQLGSSPKHFSIEEIKELDLKRWDGMPWYCRIKPGTLTIFKVTQRIQRNIQWEMITEEINANMAERYTQEA